MIISLSHREAFQGYIEHLVKNVSGGSGSSLKKNKKQKTRCVIVLGFAIFLVFVSYLTPVTDDEFFSWAKNLFNIFSLHMF